ncbi:ATP-dependent zinc metalloprotease FTSH 12, chloroplastic-like isoform X2 [Zingiber officinale]|uniref:ATP-dependent zinc metalloprotease FTSH 12, chloroplastic-like isoform X2 n=1 Tax=Zingiber officinale TaxID=94328 RepID=UPI001C4BD6C1|nr:ATP-dependent zinc metalloprotease FTSH 12, chloroplastic-like isoform X2 [Zingiber officinale]
MGSHAAHSLQIPLPRSSSPLPDPPRLFRLRPFPSPPARCCSRRRHSSRITSIRAASSSTGDGSTQFTWDNFSGSLRRGYGRFVTSFAERFRKETGLDIDGAKTGELVERTRDAVNRGRIAVDRLWMELLPLFLEWNKWENWKDIKKWEPRRIGVLLLYVITVSVSCRKFYVALTSHINHQSKRELTEAYMEALIPEPSPANVRRFKKGMWRKAMPKGLKIMKFIEGSSGQLIQDKSYVGEDAWDEDPAPPEDALSKIIDREKTLSLEDKKSLKENLGIPGVIVSSVDEYDSATWRERLRKWKEILQKEKFTEQMDSLSAKYVVDFDMQEVERSLRKEVAERTSNSSGSRALWISKRWWYYRPKLPYTYFLDKLDCSEVASVVFTEDLKRIYVTMKEGFPLEYIVDIPLDPYLFESISNSGVEVDLLQKRQSYYFFKVVFALLPGLLILYIIRESVMLLHVTNKRFLYKKYNQLIDMGYAENFILPVSNFDDSRSMYKEVVLGGDVWGLLDEIMIYMNNPMEYYEKQVAFVRGILLSGPPGTGKTLFARTLSKESGMPFVFASGAEFTDSEKSGAARINQLFSIARRNAPSFVFVDEIDAIAGRHARKDPRRCATFNALIAQLNGEKETTGLDRFSLRQAVIFICATNRPDELDDEFVRLGRIDRRLYIGLPDAKQRVQIFGVHSTGMKLAQDVDFEKLVFRTVGYSGADIRNLVNEAAIMSVRKGHSMITQKDIIDVLDKQLLEGMGVLLTEEEQQKCEASVSVETRRLLAVHEAGHILLAHLFPRFDWHAFSQLLPGGEETALSVFYPREEMVDQGYTTFGYMKMQMVVAHGGRCAEKIVFGDDVTDGGRDDLEKITRIAREMAISPRNSRLGLTTLVKNVGFRDRPDNPDSELINYKWDDPYVIPADMTPELSELFTRELTRYIEETEELAMKGLLQNRHILDAIASELFEKSRITGLEVDDRIKQMSPIMFEDLAKPFKVNLEQDVSFPVSKQLNYQPPVIYPAPLHRC